MPVTARFKKAEQKIKGLENQVARLEKNVRKYKVFLIVALGGMLLNLLLFAVIIFRG